jgi:hypothetical protein
MMLDAWNMLRDRRAAAAAFAFPFAVAASPLLEGLF